MSVPYENFVGAFLSKITEYELDSLPATDRDEIVYGYMRRALSGFKKNCKYDLFSTQNEQDEVFDVEIPEDELDEIIDIVSEGMVVQWLKPYLYKQELLENAISTRDFAVFSPAELLLRVGNVYEKAKKDYTQMIREYSYNNGDLTNLHL